MLASTAVELTRTCEDDAALLAAVADPTRLGLLRRLAAEGCRCVCELQAEPPVPANLLSYHLRILREAGLVTASRRGRRIDYRLTAGALERLHSALPALPALPDESEPAP